MTKMDDICNFYKETGSQLCHDKPGNDFSACSNGNRQNKTGACPEWPVYNSIPVLNRCIPKAIKNVGDTIIVNLYGLINSWDVIEQILGDLYKTWREILSLSFLAFGKIYRAATVLLEHFSPEGLAYIETLLCTLISLNNYSF